MIFLLLGFNVSCKQKLNSQSVNSNDSLVVNCYMIKPIKTDSNADTLRDFEFEKEPLDHLLLNISAGKKKFQYDSAMEFVTSFGYQKLITVNYACVYKLNRPDSFNLMGLYFNSGKAPWVKKNSAIVFLKNYKKNILGFGPAIVFEYRFNNVAEVEPHFMYIILKMQEKAERQYGKDYMGLVLYSDGLDWSADNERGAIPLYIQMIRRSKEIYIPLYYDGDRFIPVGHFKSPNWKE